MFRYLLVTACELQPSQVHHAAQTGPNPIIVFPSRVELQGQALQACSMQAQLAQDRVGVAAIPAAISSSKHGLDADAVQVGKPAVRASQHSTSQWSKTQGISAQCRTVAAGKDALLI